MRVTGNQADLVARRRTAWESWFAPIRVTQLASAAWLSLAWAVFSVAFVVAVVWVVTGLDRGPGAVVLVLTAGGRLSAYVGSAVGELGFLRGIWLDSAQRLAWLEDFASEQNAHTDLSAPERLSDGIRFEGVSFAYPGTTREVLRDVDLTLPGRQRGRGRRRERRRASRPWSSCSPGCTRRRQGGSPPTASTSAGSTSRSGASGWPAPSRTSPASSSWPPPPSGSATSPVRTTATPWAPRSTGPARPPWSTTSSHGLDTQLGPSWDDGVDVSFGQWQKLALARGYMRPEPLLLMLDEPTAALDAETEHALFEHFAAGAREQTSNGRVTVLVSHRFSTVRMADLIVVLDGARVVEVGSHEELMARRGTYAELYSIQAESYA